MGQFAFACNLSEISNVDNDIFEGKYNMPSVFILEVSMGWRKLHIYICRFLKVWVRSSSYRTWEACGLSASWFG